jgi:hypothetical protein
MAGNRLRLLRFANGNDWQKASLEEKRAFLFGIANAISVALGWDERHVPAGQVTFSRRAGDGLAAITLGEIMKRSTPGMRRTPAGSTRRSWPCCGSTLPSRSSRPEVARVHILREVTMKTAMAAALLLVLAAAGSVSGCSSKAIYGGMIGAGVGGLSGNAGSGMLIGAGIGGMIDEMEKEQPPQE